MKSQWDPTAWQAMAKMLQKLSLKELRQLATQVGIQFTIGNNNVTRKTEIILVLDEVNPEELESAYTQLIQKRQLR